MAFTRILGEVLALSPPVSRAEAWTCKALVHLCRTLRSRDFSAFLTLCHSAGLWLASSIDSSSSYRVLAPEGAHPVASRLGKWLSHACQRLYDLSLRLTASEASEEIVLLSDILVQAKTACFHRLFLSGDAKLLAESIICLTTICLAPPFAPLLSAHVLSNLHSILRDTRATPETFDILVAVTMPQTTKSEGEGSPTSILSLSNSVTVLDDWARALRNHSYHQLEASLWSSALGHIESLTPEVGSHYDPATHRSAYVAELERLRYDIVQRVEQAERRCYADDATIQFISTVETPKKGALVNGQWRWEDLVGCWVQKTPVCAAPMAGAKRRRSVVEDAPEHQGQKQPRRTGGGVADEAVTRHPTARETTSQARAGSVASSAGIAPVRRASSISRPRCSRPSSASTSAESSRLPTPTDDQENTSPRRPVEAKHASSRRKSNFTSILRDAQMNRVVLHADGSDDDEGVWLRGESHRLGARWPSVRQPDVSNDEMGPEDAASVLDDNPLTSDDALDLIAHQSSDW